MQPQLTISDSARDFLLDLLHGRGVEAVRIFVMQPGTAQAETCLAYCRPDDAQADDLELHQGELTVRLDKPSAPYLTGLDIDLSSVAGRSQLVMRAPNVKKPLKGRDKHVTFTRQCQVKKVPSGDNVIVPHGAQAIITQALGASYTLLYQGNLVRIEGQDADAIGLSVSTIEYQARHDGAIDEEQVWQALAQVFDPEIPVNIVSLGLVYRMHIAQSDQRVEVTMTLTAPGCGMGDLLVGDVKRRLSEVPNVATSEVELVFEPLWERSMMSEEAQLETGLFF